MDSMIQMKTEGYILRLSTHVQKNGSPGLVHNILDCDDTNDEISPDDAVEVCDDVDNNCNGLAMAPLTNPLLKMW